MVQEEVFETKIAKNLKMYTRRPYTGNRCFRILILALQSEMQLPDKEERLSDICGLLNNRTIERQPLCQRGSWSMQLGQKRTKNTRDASENGAGMSHRELFGQIACRMFSFLRYHVWLRKSTLEFSNERKHAKRRVFPVRASSSNGEASTRQHPSYASQAAQLLLLKHVLLFFKLQLA